jgi:hypothetical protein
MFDEDGQQVDEIFVVGVHMLALPHFIKKKDIPGVLLARCDRSDCVLTSDV